MAIKIEKAPNGTYTARVWSKTLDAFGKRQTKYKSGIKSVTAARNWATLTEAELSEQQTYDENITFGELATYYMESRKNKMSPTTLKGLEHIIPEVLNRFGKVKAANINTRLVQQFVNDLSQKENSHKPGQMIRKSTIEKYHHYLMAVLNWGVAQDYLEYNRVKKVEFPQDEQLFEPTIINAEQLGQVLAFLKKRCYNLYIPVLLSATMSPRRGEFLGIKWDAVDFDNNTIDISINRIMVGSQIIDRTKLKTMKSRRLLSMSDFVKNELLEHKALCEGLNSPYVCANPFSGEVPTKPDYITKTFHKVIKQEFGINMRVHDLRHCFNQMAYEDEIDETTRIKIMGHSKAETNRNIYTHTSLQRDRAAMNIISSQVEQSFKQNCEQNCKQSLKKTQPN